MFFPISGWFTAFVITLAVEVPIAMVVLRRAEPNLLRLGLLVVFANLATHPMVWYIFSQLFVVGTTSYTVAAETWAAAAEALFYATAIRGLSARRAIAVALAANAASWLIGRVVGGLWPSLFG